MIKLDINRHFYIIRNGERVFKLGRLHVETNGYQGAGEVQISIGSGAGTRQQIGKIWITGYTFYVNWMCRHRKDFQSRGPRLPLQIGLTRNANAIPSADGTHNLVKHAINFGPYDRDVREALAAKDRK